MNEIEVILEKIKKWILEEGGVVCPHKYGICKHDNENCPVFCIDQALALLREEPEPTKFTKECRALRLKGATEEQWEYAEKLGQACIYIEQLQAKFNARKEK